MNTYMNNPKDKKDNWFVVDAQDKILGKMAVRIAMVLRGKNKPEFTPHNDAGDSVVVINAAKVRVTGKKMTDKIYQTYSGYPSGRKEYTLERMLKTKPE